MRPITDEQRRERRAALIAVVRRLLDDHDYDELTIDLIASTARIAKGSVFLSFATKEEIFAALADEEYRAWFSRIEHALDADGAPADAREFAGVLFDTFAASPVLGKLIALGSAFLEAGTPLSAAIRFKRNLYSAVGSLAARVGGLLGTAPETTIAALFRAYAALLGSLELCAVPPPLRAELAQDPELTLFTAEPRGIFIDIAVGCLAPLFPVDAGARGAL